jgi:cyclic pyranopterin phosphate synthase
MAELRRPNYVLFLEVKMKQMVDISEKNITLRAAKASCVFKASNETISAIKERQLKKGDAIETAKLAGISAVKKTPEVIIYAHPIKVTGIDFNFKFDLSSIAIECTVKALDRTGVEMEALVGAAAAALNIYDMTKSIDKRASVTDLLLISKSGGKSGDFIRQE